MGVVLTDGGPAGAVYGYLFCWVGYTAVCASLSELVSMMPTAGGQYHWTFELAPPKYRKFISWITGKIDHARPLATIAHLWQDGKLFVHGKLTWPLFSISAAPSSREWSSSTMKNMAFSAGTAP